MEKQKIRKMKVFVMCNVCFDIVICNIDGDDYENMWLCI